MFTPTTVALFYSVSAGVMNGSFALPTKHIKTWTFENIWLNYSIWAFCILPWLTVFILNPQIGNLYINLPTNILLILLIGGFLFGMGQVCFALALRSIGLSLGFAITVGLATGLGSLLPLFRLGSSHIFTAAGISTIFGLILIMGGLLLSYSAGSLRDKEFNGSASAKANKLLYKVGVFLAILAGLFSAGQNYVFAVTHQVQEMALTIGCDPLTSSIVIWPPFLICSFIPYALYMLYLHVTNNSFKNYLGSRQLQNIFFGMLMGIFWFGSLCIYSKSSLLIGELGPVIVWPLFMVLIILTSNFWAWRHKEWSGCGLIVKKRISYAILFLIAAVLVLTYSAFLSH